VIATPCHLACVRQYPPRVRRCRLRAMARSDVMSVTGMSPPIGSCLTRAAAPRPATALWVKRGEAAVVGARVVLQPMAAHVAKPVSAIAALAARLVTHLISRVSAILYGRVLVEGPCNSSY
jgi:hypothetical protein